MNAQPLQKIERVAQRIHEAHAFSKFRKGSRSLNAELAAAAIAEMEKSPADAAKLVEAVKRVPMFRSNGYTKTCLACGEVYWFNDGGPVVIPHKPDCWGNQILKTVADLTKA